MDLNLTKPQREFFKLGCKYPLFVAGYGSGKSYALISRAIYDLYLDDNARVAIYSDTYDQLRLNLFPRFLETLEAEHIPYIENKSENTIKVANRELIFRSIDNPRRIIGYEVFRSHVDEIEAGTTKDKAEDVWRRIVARNRQVCGTLQNRVYAYTTPDQGFGFTYERWRKNEGDYRYVRAGTDSNPNLPPEYVANLRNDYPSELAEAFINGEWCNLTSGSVYTSFDRVECHSDRELRAGEPIYVGMDFNVQNMAAVIFVMDNGKAIAVEEMVGYLDTPTVIAAIKERYNGHNVSVYPDASGANASSKGASLSDITLLRQAGFTVRAPNANPRVRERIVCVNARLADGIIKVNTKRCPQVTECLEKQAYNKSGEPDKDAGYDHANDAFGYFVHYNFPIRARTQQRIMAR